MWKDLTEIDFAVEIFHNSDQLFVCIHLGRYDVMLRQNYPFLMSTELVMWQSMRIKMETGVRPTQSTIIHQR